MAEMERFELSLLFKSTNGLANRPLQPLEYISKTTRKLYELSLFNEEL